MCILTHMPEFATPRKWGAQYVRACGTTASINTNARIYQNLHGPLACPCTCWRLAARKHYHGAGVHFLSSHAVNTPCNVRMCAWAQRNQHATTWIDWGVFDIELKMVAGQDLTFNMVAKQQHNNQGNSTTRDLHEHMSLNVNRRATRDIFNIIVKPEEQQGEQLELDIKTRSTARGALRTMTTRHRPMCLHF